MLHSWQQFLRQRIVWICLILTILTNLTIWGVLLINIRPQPDLIILHTTVYFGVDRVGQWLDALLIPCLGLFLLLINTCFAKYFFNRARLVGYSFLVLMPIYQGFLLLATLLVVAVNAPVRI